MPERASIFQVAQLGVESAAGTPVAANKLLQTMSLEMGPKLDVSIFRPQGIKYATISALNREWVEGKLSGMMNYTEIVYLLNGCLKKIAPTGATNAKTWLYAPSSTAADTVQTYSFEQGSAVRAHKFAYGIITGTQLSFKRNGCELSADVVGQALTDGITLTAAPAALGLTPVMPPQVSVYFADTQAGLAGASALTRVVSADWAISDRFSPLWVLNAATSWVAPVETEPKLTASVLQEADAEGMGLLTQVRAGSTKWLRIKAIGAIIETTVPYTLMIDMPVKVMDVSEFKDQDGVFAVEWSLQGIHDQTWGKALEVTVINTETTATTGLS